MSKKKKSIIRKELFLVVISFVVLLSIYVAFFLDMHLKYILQKTLTKGYGAEVNIASLDLDILNTSLEIKGIDFTNHEKPMENLLSIGRFAVPLNQKDLMFASIVSEKASLQGLRVNTQRKSKGYVSPESQKLISYSTDLKGSKKKAFDQKFEGSIFENLYSFSKSKDAKQELNKLKNELNLSEMEKHFASKVEAKKKKLKQIKAKLSKERYEALITKAKKLEQNKPKSTSEWVRTASEAKELIEEIKTARKDLKQVKSDIKVELQDSKDLGKDLEASIQEKLNQLKGKFQIPDISASGIAKDFFGNLFQTRFYLIQHWIMQMRENSEQKVTNTLKDSVGEKATGVVKKNVDNLTKGEKEENLGQSIKKQAKEAKKQKSRYIHFGNNLRPKFWIKKVEIDSQSNENQDLQNFKGHILNIADNQKIIGRPIEVYFEGDVPKHKIQDIQIDIKLNHHLVKMGEHLNLAASYPISSFKIFDDSSFKLYLKKAYVRGNIKGDILGEKLSNFKLINDFQDTDFLFEASKGDLQKILAPIFAEVENFDVNVLFEGKFLDPKMLIESSIAKKISQGLKERFSAELSKGQDKINNLAQEKFSELQSKYLGEYAKDLNIVNGDQTDLQNLLDQQVQKLEAKLDEQKSQKTDALKNKAKEKLKGLFN